MKNLRESRFLWLLLVAVAIWAQARPTQGVRHDAILYMAQVLSHVHPEVFHHDIFFAYGSQDSYSIYSRLLAPLLQAGLMDTAPLVLLWTAHLGLLMAAWVLLRQMPMSALQAGCGLVAMAALSHLYGGRDLIAFGEEFLTARTLAEPLALWALVVYVLHRPWWQMALPLLGAAAFHPLITLPAVMVLWVCLCREDRRWLWLLLALPLAILLGWWGVAPLDQLVQRYDDTWWEALTPHVLMPQLSTWRISTAASIVFDAIVVAWVARQSGGRFATLLQSSIVVALAALLLSYLVGELGRNVLVFSLQTWRSLWILHLLAVIVLPWLVIRCGRQGPRGQLLALALVLAGTNSGWQFGGMFVVWLALVGWIYRSAVPVSPALIRLMQGTTMLSLLVVTLVSGRIIERQIRVSGGDDYLNWWNIAMQLPALPWLLGTLLLLALSDIRRPVKAAGTVLLVLLLAGGLLGWDQRHSWLRYQEQSLTAEHPFERHVRPDQQVYWDHDVNGSWFLLKRANYFSINQGGGVLFNRRTALDYRQRAMGFAPLEVMRKTCAIFQHLNDEDGSDRRQSTDECFPTLEIVQELCDTESRLDFLVFGRDLGKGKVAEWSPSPKTDPPYRTYWLYSCELLRQSTVTGKR